MAENNAAISYNTNISPEEGSNAIFAVELAGLAYKSQKEIEEHLVTLGYDGTKVFFFGTQLTGGFLIEWGDVICVAFRGSSSLREWLNNLKIWSVETEIGRLHAGLYQSFIEVGPFLFKLVLPGILSGYKLIVTGHSRGGALALLFAALVHFNRHSVHAVYTFGSPKVGDQVFVDWSKIKLNAPVLNFVSGNDPVPSLPPSNLKELRVLLRLINNTIFFILPMTIVRKAFSLIKPRRH